MVPTIARKEVTIIRRDGRLWLLPFVLGLFAAGLFAGYQQYQRLARQQQSAQAENYDQWLHQGQKNAHQGAHFGLYAFKPAPLLALVDKGLTDYLGSSVWLEAHKQNDVKFPPIRERTNLARFGDLTVAFLLVYLVPLLIIMFTFDSFTAEKETGTLRLLLSAGVSPGRLLTGKFLGIFRVVSWLLVPVFLGINLFLLVAGGAAAYLASLGAVLIMSGICLLFYGVCTLLGVTVSALANSSGTALTVLLAAWIVGSFVVPRLSTYAAKQIYPTPSGIAFTRQVNYDKEFGLGGVTNEQRKAQFEESLRRQYQVKSLEELPVGYAGLSLQNGEDFGNQIFDKHYGALHRQFRKQNQVLATGAFFSPVVAVRQLLMGFAGTNVDHHLDFTNQAEAHRRLMQRKINAHYARIARGKETGQEVNTELWQQIPPFTYTPAAVGTTIKNQMLNLLTLLAWAVAIGVGSYGIITKKLSC